MLVPVARPVKVSYQRWRRGGGNSRACQLCCKQYRHLPNSEELRKLSNCPCGFARLQEVRRLHVGEITVRGGKRRQGEARPGMTWRGKTGQARARQGHTRQNKAMQRKGRQKKARQCKGKQGKARRGKAKAIQPDAEASYNSKH